MDGSSRLLLRELEDLGDRLLTRAEVAELFQVSPSTVTRWAEAGMLPAVKTLGGHRRYEAKTVLELAKNFIQQGGSMENVSFEVPFMYADHHVLQVREMLLAIPGVEEVYASSLFKVVEISYDPDRVSQEDLKAKLSEAGYLDEMPLPTESGIAVTCDGCGETFFRHTAAYKQRQQVVGFEQNVSYKGRPLWPCPGMGVIQRIVEEA
jgi:excisionase family DNA binding protein